MTFDIKKVLASNVWLFAGAVIFSIPNMASACEAYSGPYPSIAETVKKSDLIIIGKWPDSEKLPEKIDPFFNPDYDVVTIDVVKVLKGETGKKQIRTRSGWGMCGTAFIFPDRKERILFLWEIDNIRSGIKDENYEPANDYNGWSVMQIDDNGRAVHTLSMYPDELIKRYGKWPVKH